MRLSNFKVNASKLRGVNTHIKNKQEEQFTQMTTYTAITEDGKTLGDLFPILGKLKNEIK